MIVMDGEEFLTAQEACALLEVKAATLYAYVSRGMLNSYRQGIKRTRLYRRAEVERLTRLHGPDDEATGAFLPGARRGENDEDEQDTGAWIPYV